MLNDQKYRPVPGTETERTQRISSLFIAWSGRLCAVLGLTLVVRNGLVTPDKLFDHALDAALVVVMMSAAVIGVGAGIWGVLKCNPKEVEPNTNE